MGGFLQLDRRFVLSQDSLMIADFYNRFRPELSAAVDASLYFFVSLDMRFYSFPTLRSTSDLEDVEQHFPTELTVWEGYVRLSEFLVEGLDLTIGKQRIQWGTADELNPTDNLNAYDFSDLIAFTARIPTWAARFEYYVADLRLEAVWLPTVHPPLLPPGGAALFLGGKAVAALVSESVDLDTHIEPPSRRLANSGYAVKLSGFAAGFDYSVSYFNGFDGIPVLRRLELSPRQDSSQTGTLTGDMWFTFTRNRTIGADFATEKGGVGIWGEGALVFPAEVPLVTVVLSGPDSTVETSVALEGSPFFQSTVGLDYTFPGGWYANAQWVHGLFFERGANNLHDYLVSSLEKKLLRDELKVVVGGALEVASWSDISGNLGYGVFPEVVYSPVDNLEMAVGAFLVDGRGRSLFGAWNTANQMYLQVKVNF